MHKQYPYLEDSYVYQTDLERQKRALIADISNFVNQRQYIKITLLDWDENPLKEIEGEISSGSISKVADSPVRRTAQLSCAVDARSYSVEDGKADFAINKKVFIEVGVLNETPHYKEYPIFWFPEGVFFIASFSINSSSNSSTNITLSLKDKMAMLNGDVGGTLPATVIFDSMDTQLPNGEYIEKKVLIYNIIKELVNHYGGEDLNRIVIQGVPLRIRRVMQWNGDTPLYQKRISYNVNSQDYVAGVTESDGNYIYTLEDPGDDDTYTPYYKGDDVGYIMDDFVVINELTGAPGETVTAILDKIKNLLGNYEYFYDVFGVFHFREIRNYYVTTQARTLLDEMAENDYLVEANNERSTFTFNDTNLLTSVTINPKYENIKNDYIVMGHTETNNGINYDVRYHLAIDKKPRIQGKDNRDTVSRLINNDEAIAQLKEQLANNKIILNNNEAKLENIQFQINRALQYIAQRKDHYWGQDKLLFKFLTDRYPFDNELALTSGDMINIFGETEIQKYGYASLWLYYFFENNWNSEKMITTEEEKNIILDIIYNNLYNNYITDLDSQLDNIEININNWTMQKTVMQNFINLINNYDVYNVKITTQQDERNPSNLGWYERGIWDDENGYYNYNLSLDTEVNPEKTYYEKIESPRLVQQKQAYADAMLEQYPNSEYNYEMVDEKYQNYTNSINDIQKIINNYEEEKQIISKTKERLNLDWYTNEEGSTEKYGGIDYDAVKTILDNMVTDYNQWTDKEAQLYGVIGTSYEGIIPETFYQYYIDNEIESLYYQWYNCLNIIEDETETTINDIEEQIAALEAVNHKNFDNGQDNPDKNRRYYEIYPNENEGSLILYEHPRNGGIVASFGKEVEELPDVGNFNLVYQLNSDYYYWDGEIYQQLQPLGIYTSEEDKQYYCYDWRTKLYLDGLRGVNNGTDKGYYYEELAAFWPRVYDLVNQCFYGEKENKNIYYKSLTAMGTYYLDFLDSLTTSFGEWSVDNIGRRSDIVVNDEINCLFQPEIPNIIIIPRNEANINNDLYSNNSLERVKTIAELRQEAIDNYYPWTQVDDDIYNNLITGGYRNGAFDQIKYELYLYTRYQKNISMTCIPVFYLEPNSRITINDPVTNTYGDFIIQSINITFGPGANMSVTCNETAERF